MKPPILTLVIALITLPALLAADPGTEEDKQALRDLAAIYETAIAEDDLARLEQHLAEGFTSAMVTGERVEGFAGLEDYWEGLKELIGEGGSYRVTLEPEDTDFRNGVAVAKGNATERVTLSSGSEITFPSQWTAVCIQEDGAWKLLRAQGTMNPVENPFIARAFKVTAITAGGIAGIAGILVGLLIGSRFRRKK